MTQKISPYIEANYGWDFGEDGWNSGMDQNLLKFSFMFDRNIDAIVDTLPAAVNGKAYYLSTDNRLYFVVGTSYFSTPIPKWFTVFDRNTGDAYTFDGTSLVVSESLSPLAQRLDDVELTISSLGSAAFQDASDFATTAALDVVEANTSAYTDELRTDLSGSLSPTSGAGIVGFSPSIEYPADSLGSFINSLSNLKYPESFPSLAEWAASGGALGITAGVYPVTEQLSFPFGTTIVCFGEVILDASSVVDALAFPDLTIVKAGGGSLTALPDITTSSAGGLSNTFNSAHGLVSGDVYIIYNPTDSSYSSHRTYYRAGEFRKVSIVTSTTEVRCDSPQYAGYLDTAVDVYKLNGGSFSVVGSLVVKGADTVKSLRAFRGHRLIDSDISGLKAICPTGPAAIELFQCFNVSGVGVSGVQNSLSGTGTDYGLVMANCQRIDISGQFTASRHGVTTGGFDELGCVVNRDITISGYISTNLLGGVPAANTHGNAEFVTFSGHMVGCSLGGNFITVRGDVSGFTAGRAIEMVEMSGHDRDLRGVRIKSLGDPGAVTRGVIDLGANTNPAAADTVGGVIDCSGMIVDAPQATRVFVFRQRVATVSDIRIKLNNAEILSAASGAISLLVSQVSGANIASLNVSGFMDHSTGTHSVASVGEIIGASARGVVSGTTSTSASFLEIPISFPSGRFLVAPIITCSIDKTLIGVKGVVSAITGVSATGATIRIATIDNTNFSSAVLVTARWEATTER